MDLENVLDRPVLLKFDCASESFGELLKPQTAGPHSQFLIPFFREIESETCMSNELLGC